jgi:hypothetical protein
MGLYLVLCHENNIDPYLINNFWVSLQKIKKLATNYKPINGYV